MSRSKTIIITANESWSTLWFSKQHYAFELSQMGFSVYFVDPPSNWKPWHLFSFSTQSRDVNKNLTILSYNNNFPLRIFRSFFLSLNDYINSWKIAKTTKQDQAIWWQFDPFRFINIHFFSKIQRIYHVVDPFQHIWSDREIAKQADLVVSVSNYYKDYYLKYNKSYLYVPHGVSTFNKEPNPSLSEDIRKQYGEGYIVFIGTVNIDVDLALMKMLAESLKKHLLLIIGPQFINGGEITYFKELCNLPNVKYIAGVSSKEMHLYLSKAKVGIVPYKLKRTENVHRTPLKIMSYIENRLPVVTTLNYELTELNNKCIFAPNSNQDFIEKVHALINGEITVNHAEMEKFIQINSYPQLINRILNSLESSMSSHKSI